MNDRPKGNLQAHTLQQAYRTHGLQATNMRPAKAFSVAKNV